MLNRRTANRPGSQRFARLPAAGLFPMTSRLPHAADGDRPRSECNRGSWSQCAPKMAWSVTYEVPAGSIRTAFLGLEPGLKHQHIPEIVLPVSFDGEVLVPFERDDG